MKKALLVGIDEYGWDTLNSCVKDVNRLTPLFARHENGDINYNCLSLTSDQRDITTDFLRKQLKEFFRDESEQKIFYFSGHGNEAVGGSLCTKNSTRHNPGIPMLELLHFAHENLEKRKTREIIIILDCCFSGGFGEFSLIGKDNTMLKKGLSIMTSSRSNEFSKTNNKNDGSIFTEYLIDALEGGTKDILGNITLTSAYNYMDQLLGSWEQRPTLKLYFESMPTLRMTSPLVTRDELRKITTYFGGVDEVHMMSSAYPDTENPRSPEKELIFTHFLKYQRAGLIIPVGEKNMYPAAMKNLGCKLTNKGKAYWNLVSQGKI